MMSKMIRTSDQALIVNEIQIAKSYFSRLRGLIGIKKFEMGEGLLITQCNSVHMWMMSVPIDVVFLKSKNKIKKEWTVLSVHSGLKPWKMLPVSNMKADDVLELPLGVVQSLTIRPGEVMCIV